MTNPTETPKEKAQPKGEPTFEHDICLYRAGAEGETESHVFRSGEEIPPKSDGWVDHPSLILVDDGPSADDSEPVIDAEKVQMAADLASAKELIGKLDEAGAKVAGERDEARGEVERLRENLKTADGGLAELTKHLADEQAAHGDTKGKLEAAEAEVGRLAAEVAKVDPDKDGKVGGSVAKK